jgi:Rps23 Pro-64 3,4-dihydroxylase Tpa1-like proline 4-hydroxylase
MIDVLAAQWILIPNFLKDEARSQLLTYVLSQADQFVPTSTSTGEIDYRKSQILYNFPEFSDWMTHQVGTKLPEIFTQLDVMPFTPSQIEIQLTAHNDGNYYKIHNDNGSGDAATRTISYVYYFYREPKGFSGGELRLYDLSIEQGYYSQAESYTLIEPQNNSLIFFPSHTLHEVMPVVCPSRSFADSRFTLNGWIRR